jgi:hypothetical protein
MLCSSFVWLLTRAKKSEGHWAFCQGAHCWVDIVGKWASPISTPTLLHKKNKDDWGGLIVGETSLAPMFLCSILLSQKCRTCSDDSQASGSLQICAISFKTLALPVLAWNCWKLHYRSWGLERWDYEGVFLKKMVWSWDLRSAEYKGVLLEKMVQSCILSYDKTVWEWNILEEITKAIERLESRTKIVNNPIPSEC